MEQGKQHDDALTEGASEKERMADQQFGAQASRDADAADAADKGAGVGGPRPVDSKLESEKVAENPPRAGNKEDDLA
jgi:hypothetical protein